jgi:hypothetical protein
MSRVRQLLPKKQQQNKVEWIDIKVKDCAHVHWALAC